QAIAHSVRAEGVQRIALVSDAPEKFDRRDLPDAVTIHHRRELDTVQRELRDVPGVTVLIYEQACATEKRRRRKRGQLEDPARFVMINDLVCEGCGDCSVESNCLSVVPKETPLGRKRQIDQNSCNKDYSCLNGFCPSFVTVEGGRRRRPEPSAADPRERAAALEAPVLPPVDTPYDLLVTGVGGTGVVTVGQVITMAAHLEGKGASVLDFMGFAQKFGPVLSYLRLAATPAALNQVRIGPASADALIGCDLVVSSSPKASLTYARSDTRAVLSTTEMATADFVLHRDASLSAAERIEAVRGAVAELDTVDANALAAALLGDSIYANVLMTGFAWQRGLIPVGLAAMQRAIELNGVKVDENLQAFAWGRLAAADPETIAAAGAAEAPATAETLEEVIERRRAFLADYQNEALAGKYEQRLARLKKASGGLPAADAEALLGAVARSYFKLLSYKDEYEVARLHTQAGFEQRVAAVFDGDYRIHYHMAPPLLAAAKDARGRPRKKQFGPWLRPVLAVLARGRRLRGTPFDPFGYTRERRDERALIAEFEGVLDRLEAGLDEGCVAQAIEIARLPMAIRGFGPVKEEAVATYRLALSSALAAL
ncbi:MAG: indolepyruvate ferredoxin oxidoreductase family protein, partial [Pseudomonadota bacterium]